jgi:PAS domain S-box-containing protein
MDSSLPDAHPAGSGLPASQGADPGDLSSLRHAQQALRQAEGRAALVASAVGLGIWEIDLQTGHTAWDEQMWRLRGLQPHAQVPDAEQRLALVHPDDRERVSRINPGTETASYQFRILRPDGQQRWLASRAATLHDEQGRPLRRIGVNWDITAQREAEMALQQHEQALRESQGRARSVARLSHDLRTPLNAILGCCQLLRADDEAGRDEPRQRRRLLAEVEAAGHQLLALADRVLDLSSRVPTAPLRMPPPPPPPAPGPGHRTLLYIEDNEVNALIVSELVARRGDLRLVVAATGAEGLRLADELLPALVLLDMQLPDIDGAEVFSRLRASARTAALPCVALSANALGSDIDAALAAGMTAYWTKPLDFRAFTQWLDGVFGPAPPRSS